MNRYFAPAACLWKGSPTVDLVYYRVSMSSGAAPPKTTQMVWKKACGASGFRKTACSFQAFERAPFELKLWIPDLPESSKR